MGRNSVYSASDRREFTQASRREKFPVYEADINSGVYNSQFAGMVLQTACEAENRLHSISGVFNGYYRLLEIRVS